MIDVVGLGFMKCGSSTLRDWLVRQGDLRVFPYETAPLASPDFADNMNVDVSDDKVNCVVSPTYSVLNYETSARNLYKHNPKIKFIFITRNRAERAFSHWNMAYISGWDNRPFLQAITENIEKEFPSIDETEWLRDCYIEAGNYNKIINTYTKYFSPAQFLGLRFDEIISNELIVKKRLSEFLDIDLESSLNTDFDTVNATTYEDRQMGEGVKKLISGYYKSLGEYEA